MSATETRERVLRSARRLFGERGYASVTIREVAGVAGVSPAMVMKIAGSKEQLHALARPAEPAPLLPDTPLEGMGELLVRRMLTRRDEEAAEPWLRALYLFPQAPDRETALADFRQRFLGRFPSEGEDRRHVEQLACLMIGLAAGVRTFGLLEGADDEGLEDAVVREYGALVQAVLDRLDVPRATGADGGTAVGKGP
ncbi:TetR/AcrR family transcriptional regulator [Ornithinimicrobium cerasi]|uniref:TetR/AcrR family transcriptional regulator n=1 Tax=Ornithinimicrobium cerasi TaxID=2248773 RepID=UPI000EFFACCB|nr:TetR/AcrR family transcriptional regulator [Ornithinimicrobium cerasi]